ncbi:MAG: DNA methyltransferase [Bacillota bacterium]|nr:DNA methyltransferase [Bacillota bacterium]
MIFNTLYAFCSRYYDSGDFLSKRRYSRNEKYAIPYNGEEVYLHWANHDQYYIKTGEYFTDYRLKAPNGVSVHFKLKQADVEQNNVKGEDRFFVPLSQEAQFDMRAQEVVIPFEYRPLTAQEQVKYAGRNQQDSILAEAPTAISDALKMHTEALAAVGAVHHKTADGVDVSYLEHHLRQYTQRNTSDFFIHKDLKGFLTRELDFYLKNEVLSLDELEAAGESRTEGWFQIMRVIRAIGGRIIEFLAQIEDFQKMLFEKRKLITETQYCITVGNIAEAFYADIAANDASWQEWKALFHIDEEQTNLFTNGKSKRDKRIAFLKTRPTLVVDTKHFDQDFRDRLLASFDDLDGMTDGLLVHSENFQALNLLLEKYRGKVKCIYIDPPFNADSSEIIYRNSYKHSSWLSLFENRARIAISFLTNDFVFITAIDEVEQEVLGRLLLKLFPSCEKSCITVVHNATGQQGVNFSYTHESAYFVFPKPGRYIGLEDRSDNPDVRPLRNVSKGAHLRSDAANCFYPIFIKDGVIIGFGEVSPEDFHPPGINVVRDDGIIEVFPIDPQGTERKWVFARDTVESILDELEPRYDKAKGIWDIIRTKKRFNYKTVWTGPRYSANSYGSRILNEILPGNSFTFPKSIHTVRDCVDAALGNRLEGCILDFFAGSGTTGHSIINLNREDGGTRKFILVEMGEYFDTVLLPRIKKVTYSPEWKDGKPKRMATPEEAARSPRIVKYIRLESYEDALNNIEVNEQAGQAALKFDDYMLSYMLDWETRESPTRLNLRQLAAPFAYKLRITRNQATHEQVVDVPETFAYLLGLHVRTRRVHDDNGRRYLVDRGALDHREVVVIWRDTAEWEQKEYERDRTFVAEQKLAEGTDEVFINGDSLIPGARSLDGVFKSRMFAPVGA